MNAAAHKLLAPRIEGVLQSIIQILRPHNAPVHRREHLNVLNGVVAKGLRDSVLDHFDNFFAYFVLVVFLKEKKVRSGRIADVGGGWPYEALDLEDLTLSYAVSIHKSQGSEYPVVVIPLVMSHFIMLQRNLIYTGITRGKKLVVVIGSQKALFAAVNNNKIMNRNTWLGQRLAKTVSL